MKKICIICNEEKEDFNIEHIIPKSLGNSSLTINSVCTCCNSLLGRKVDTEITNNFISELYRFDNGLKGYTGKIPNPFARGGITEEGRAVHVNDELKPQYTPKIQYDKDEQIISVEANSFEEAIEMIDKKLNRLGKSALTEEEKLELKNTYQVKEDQPVIKYDFSIKTDKLYLSLIKIGFEFAYHVHGDIYLDDEIAKILQQTLKKYVYEDKIDINLKEYVMFMPDEISNTLIRNINQVKESTKSNSFHMLCAVNNNEGAYVYIIIDEIYKFIIRVGKCNKELHKTQLFFNILPSGESIII